MRSATARELTLLDVMVLVAAVAIGIAGGRVQLALLGAIFRSGYGLLLASVWLALALSAGVLVLRLKSPRASWRRLFCQPGAAAGVAVLVTLALISAKLAVDGLFQYLGGAPGYSFDFVFVSIGTLLPDQTGCAVAAGWAILALGRRWRPERSWIDRLGTRLVPTGSSTGRSASWPRSWTASCALEPDVSVRHSSGQGPINFAMQSFFAVPGGHWGGESQQ